MDDKQNQQGEPRENSGTKPGGKLMENKPKGWGEGEIHGKPWTN